MSQVKKHVSMSAAIRDLLAVEPTIASGAALEHLRTNGFKSLNEKTFRSTFYMMRRKLKVGPKASQTRVHRSDITGLTEAARFLANFDGDFDSAVGALTDVQALQIPRKPR